MGSPRSVPQIDRCRRRPVEAGPRLILRSGSRRRQSPNTAQPSARPAAHFARLAQDALARGWQAWVFGSGKDQAIADEIVRLAGAPTGLVNLCGRTGLDQAIDLMSLARLAVCNDSGLMHIAAALRVPLVVMFVQPRLYPAAV